MSNKKRIKIDGDWYVKDDSYQELKSIDHYLDGEDIVVTKSYIAESRGYYLELILLVDERGMIPLYDIAELSITDKRIRDHHKKFYWDNPDFINRLSEDSVSDEDMKIAKEEGITDDLLGFILAFLRELKRSGWI